MRIKLMFFISASFSLTSCFEKGFDNAYGIYVPKKPKFELKDKMFLFPSNLDTNSIYVLEKMYYDNKLILSFRDDIWPDYYSSSKNHVNAIVFLSKGRCLSVNLPLSNRQIDFKSIKSDNFTPEKNHKDYYFFDGNKIQIESFVYGEGYGRYLIFDYFLDENGQILIQKYKLSESIYRKYSKPNDINFPKVNW